MAESTGAPEGAAKASGTSVKIVGVKEDYPPVGLPTFYADGILNLAPGTSTCKFYLYRHDPNLKGTAEYLVQPFAQVVMPTPSFLQTAIFFEEAIQSMLAQGIITQAQLDEQKLRRARGA